MVAIHLILFDYVLNNSHFDVLHQLVIQTLEFVFEQGDVLVDEFACGNNKHHFLFGESLLGVFAQKLLASLIDEGVLVLLFKERGQQFDFSILEPNIL